MTNHKKKDSGEILEFLTKLKSASWLGKSRSWWPDYLYHYTDINNAIKILETGELLSRTQAEKSSCMKTDNASPTVIGQTDIRWKDYVRLYFRPKTPTQYRNEGFRPKNKLELGGAHCPLPIYFLFDTATILCMDESLFSKGSLATGTKPFNTAKALRTFPFEKIYHDSYLTPLERSDIVFHRHAEVIIPKKLNLNSLRHIWCRTSAEYITLITLLSQEARDKWIHKIGSGDKPNLFFKNWSFVEDVNLSKEEIEFYFNKSTFTPTPFKVRVDIIEKATNMKYFVERDEFVVKDNWKVLLSSLKAPEDYFIKFYLDGHIAFASRFIEEEIPF